MVERKYLQFKRSREKMSENLTGAREQPYARYERWRQSSVSRQNGSLPRSAVKALCEDEDEVAETSSTSPTAPKRQAAERGRGGDNPLMVHIIEDEDSIRRAVSFMLKKSGLQRNRLGQRQGLSRSTAAGSRRLHPAGHPDA